MDFSQINVEKDNLPSNIKELEVHMQLDYKQSVEIAEEEVINNTLAFNKYQFNKKKSN